MYIEFTFESDRDESEYISCRFTVASGWHKYKYINLGLLV